MEFRSTAEIIQKWKITILMAVDAPPVKNLSFYIIQFVLTSQRGKTITLFILSESERKKYRKTIISFTLAPFIYDFYCHYIRVFNVILNWKTTQQ